MQSGQGADEVLGGYYWYPPLLEAAGGGLDTYAARVLRPRRRGRARAAAPSAAPDDDVSRAFARRRGSRAPGAATPVDRALRLDTEVMLVDDPVKRVDNMTMAHGLEARTPFLDHELVELAAALPAGAQARRRRQGRAQGRRARRRARRGDRPPEGLLPRARADPPRGPGARAWSRDALLAPAARDARPLPARGRSTRCSPIPTRTARTSTARRCGSSALLELWLQRHVG